MSDCQPFEIKGQVNAITLALAEDFRRDSYLFGEGVRNPGGAKPDPERDETWPSRPERQKWLWAR
jgi:hypothetical protein